MSLRTKKAKKVLTKAEQRHLTEVGIHSMANFLYERETQVELGKRWDYEVCHTCRAIALKLGLEE